MNLELRAARKLLKVSGWVGPAHEPWCVARGPGVRANVDVDQRGSNIGLLWLPTRWFHTLDVNDEGLERYSVRGACLAAGADLEQLEQTFSPDGSEILQQWLQWPERKVGDVLRVLTSAVLRSERESRT